MALFRETEVALSELAATRQLSSGAHSTGQIKAGIPGLALGERDFDAARDPASAVLALSFMEDVFDSPQVRQVIPYKPMDVNVIVDNSPVDDHPDLIRTKRAVAQEIKTSIFDALHGRDHSYYYVIGKPTGRDITERVDGVIDAENDPIDTAVAINRLCLRGLTFIVSDFKDLPLEQVEKSAFGSAIAVKVNHPFELSADLPPELTAAQRKRIFLTINKNLELRPNKANKLEAANRGLEKLHSKIDARLQRVGIAVAHAVLNPGKRSGIGFDYKATDHELAAAVRSKKNS